MFGYAIAFLLGGYLIPASMHVGGIYSADRRSPDRPTVGESVMTALIEGAMWPARVTRYEGK